MVLHGEEKFNKYISSFSKLIRNTFEMSNLDKISLDDELDYIENYIDLQALRLEKQFKQQFILMMKLNLRQPICPA